MTMTEQKNMPSTDVDPVRRRSRLIWIAGGVIAIAAVVASWKLLVGDVSRETDDAYVSGHSVLLTPQVAGTITMIHADNTDRVKAGDVLITIDSTDAQIELDAAEAQLAQAVRTVRGQYANVGRAEADIGVEQAALDKARADLKERESIAASGAITGEEVRHARDAVRQTEAALAASEQSRLQALTQTQGATTLQEHPTIRVAIQRVRTAVLALERTRILAPVSGMISQRKAQVGRRVSPGDPLLAIVPLNQLWVDANFKEVQLDKVCAGQNATMTTDLYGSQVIYHGRVRDIEAGSGAAFALLPAQNATGNWIKVVQRVPVRIGIDPGDLAAHPLRVGVSMRVDVDVRSCPHASDMSNAISDGSAIYNAQVDAANARVAQIIADNLQMSASTGVLHE